MKLVNYIFIFSFLAIITLPLVFLDTKSTITENENRTLAVFPGLLDEGKINTDKIMRFPKLLDDYIGDRFGFRNEAISFINRLDSAGTFLWSRYVLGKDGWLFYSGHNDGNNINDFLKINLFTQDEIKRFILNIESRLKWCNENNIKFVFLIAPNKHNIYPEYYPLERPSGITRTDQIMLALPDNLKDIVLYPRDYILSKKTPQVPVYFETDTHWNMLGASYAYDLIFEKLKKDFPDTVFPDIEVKMEVSSDTIVNVVPGFTSYGKMTNVDIQPKEGWTSYYTYSYHTFDKIITNITNNDSDLPKAIIFRDSFFDALEPFTSTLFSYAEYSREAFNGNEKTHILNNKPDVIIWEVVERYLSRIPNNTWD
jgi:hypothetical protein